MKIQNLKELDFAAQREVIGGVSAQGCSCTCTCTCEANQKSSSIDSQADDTKNSVTNQMNS